MAKEYPLLYGYAGNVEEELHNTNEVADFIMKHGVNSDVTITTPLDALLLNTYGIYIPNRFYERLCTTEQGRGCSSCLRHNSWILKSLLKIPSETLC